MKDFTMVVYSKDNCPFCVKAKALLEQKGIKYSENKIGKDIQPDEFFDLYPNVRTVPHIVKLGTVSGAFPIGGYDDLVEYIQFQETQQVASEMSL